MPRTAALVKLNNPLIGTEKQPYQSIMQGTLLVQLVKLNNPHQGTETHTQYRLLIVKM